MRRRLLRGVYLFLLPLVGCAQDCIGHDDPPPFVFDIDGGPIDFFDGDFFVDGGPAFSDGGIPEGYLEDVCSTLANSLCTSRIACGCGSRGDTCVSRETSVCLDHFASRVAAVDQGLLGFNAATLGDCTNRLISAWSRCDTSFGLEMDCTTAFYEPVGYGETCSGELSRACAGGDGICDGTCEPLGYLGNSCTPACHEGLWCSEDTCVAASDEGATCLADYSCRWDLICVDGQCAVPLYEGSACTSQRACNTGLRCVDGLCVAVPSTCESSTECGRAECAGIRAGECAPTGDVGDACTEDVECRADLTCDPTTRVCVELPTRGESCAGASRCEFPSYCDLSFNVCLDLPVDGTACGNEDERFVLGVRGPGCGVGLSCGTDDLCHPSPADGEPCGRADVCGDGLRCFVSEDGGTRTCSTPRANGESCIYNPDCNDASYCDLTTSVCASRLAEGVNCGGDSRVCEEGLLCLAGASGGVPRCITPPTVGETCPVALPDSCASGAYCAEHFFSGTCRADVCARAGIW